jgi:exopolysaccharide production protein ExoQ
MMNAQNSHAGRPFYVLVNTWILFLPLLVFAATNGFSFEKGSINGSGAYSVGIRADNSQEGAITAAQSTVVYFLCVLLFIPLIKLIASEFRSNALLLSLLLWMVMSVAWTGNLQSSVLNAVKMILNIILAVYLYLRFSLNHIMKLIILVGAVAVLGSITMVLLFPEFGIYSRSSALFGAWQGIFTHKNICGMTMLFLLLPAFFLRSSNRTARVLRLLYIGVVLLIIALTQSVGSWVVTCLCLAFISEMKLLARVRRKDTILVAFVSIAMVAVAVSAVIYYFDALMPMLGKSSTMSGRTVIWAGLVHSVREHPLLGYGYMGFWQGHNTYSVFIALQQNLPGMSYAENGVLELLLELGLVGVILYFLLFFRAVKDAVYCFRHDPSPATQWCIAILFYVAVTNIEAGILLSPSSLVCILPFVVYGSLRQEASRILRLQYR